MFRMPTCDLSQFTELEQEIIRPLLDHKNKLRTHKPPFITKDQEYLFVALTFKLLWFSDQFIVPYQSVRDSIFNPYYYETSAETESKLIHTINFLLNLADKFIKHSTLKVY